jgi:16S rRNA (cytosine1402-N4)-methyltransferase
MDALIFRHGVGPVDGVALDIGVSSMQLDTPERGFSFRRDGPLDMRMSKSGLSAADVVNDEAERPLADIIHRYGEERFSRRIARAIVEARRARPIERTGELAEIVRRAYPADRRRGPIDPATRTFQAIRIHVNDEIGELVCGLAAAEALLGPGGRLAVVSFHSLEDREVKSFLRARAGMRARASRHAPPTGDAALAPTFRLLARAPVAPTADEIAANPRARSARLRSAERTLAPAWTAGDPA